MAASTITGQRNRVCRALLLAAGGLLTAIGWSSVAQEPARPAVLRIGVSATSLESVKADQQETARDTLKDFIKQETGFANELVTLKSYKEVSEQLAAGKLHLALLEGFELAWIAPDYPKFKSLTVAVNDTPYHCVDVVLQAGNQAADFGKLQGRSLSLAGISQAHVRLYVDREARAQGKDLKTFFSKITSPYTVEEALDEVVDGMADVAVVDQLSLAAYKRRKPGRFQRLRQLVRSPAFPPASVVYQQGSLDDATLRRFRDGMINSKNKDTGKMLLNLYKLTAFEGVPKDFDRVLHDTLKRFPPPENP
jgi:ABC-type phosphate/phosphonate transport system substrate-binding protein